MVVAKSIRLYIDKNNKTHFELLDNNGISMLIPESDIIKAINENKLTVINMRINENNKLVFTNCNEKDYALRTKIAEIENKVTILGGNVLTVTTACGHTCKVIFTSKDDAILYIPEDVIELNYADNHNVRDAIKNVTNSITVVGGRSLQSTSSMFLRCKAEHYILNDFNTENVTNMIAMFAMSKIKEAYFPNINTSSVKVMSSMFSMTRLDKIDLSNFDTHNVEDMQFMFNGCKVAYGDGVLDLGNFDTSKVKNMASMFQFFEGKELNLKSFNTRNVCEFSSMFAGSKIDKLDLSSFRITHCACLTSMFFESKINELDISGFQLYNTKSKRNMFGKASIETIYLPRTFMSTKDGRATDFKQQYEDIWESCTIEEAFVRR